MERTAHVWGERWLIKKDSTNAVAFLKLIKGYRCSWHYHIQKYNLFVVISGKIGVIVEELGSKREMVLETGQSCTIKPGQLHEFRVYENSQVIEIMYVEYDESDIIRENIGGLING
jgi:mannose-6-phosphate isomerase-like protein (cupin superfamily)